MTAFGLQFSAPDKISRWPAIPFTSGRLWGATWGGAMTNWAGVQSQSGTYSWSALDNLVALYRSKGLIYPLMYTFGYTPGWANGNASRFTPPTSIQDMKNFATAVVGRYATQITHWEPLNEIGTWWLADTLGGSVSQTTMSWVTWLYPVIKAADPAAVVGTPSFYGSGSFALADSFYAQGGGSYSDVLFLHPYPMSSFYGTAPEQSIYTTKIYRQILAGNGVNQQMAWTEGDWGGNTPAAQMQPAAAIMPLIASSEAISHFNWYSFDAMQPGSVWGGLTDGGTGLNINGVTFHEATKWVAGASWTSKIARQALTNQVAQPNGAGAVAGGTNFGSSGWMAYNPDSGNGITWSITSATGGVSIRVHGTANASAVGYVRVAFSPDGNIVASSGQYWAVGATAVLAATGTGTSGSRGGMTTAELGYYITGTLTSGGQTNQYLTQPLAVDLPVYPVLAMGNDVAACFLVPTSALGTVTGLTPMLKLSYTPGTTVDFTVTISNATADPGSIYSGVFTRTGSYQGMAIWDANGGPTNYTVPSGYSYMRDWKGTITPITAGATVSLTSQPVLLDNQLFKAWKH